MLSGLVRLGLVIGGLIVLLAAVIGVLAAIAGLIATRQLRKAIDAAGGIRRIQRLQSFWDRWEAEIHHRKRVSQNEGNE